MLLNLVIIGRVNFLEFQVELKNDQHRERTLIMHSWSGLVNHRLCMPTIWKSSSCCKSGEGGLRRRGRAGYGWRGEGGARAKSSGLMIYCAQNHCGRGSWASSTGPAVKALAISRWLHSLLPQIRMKIPMLATSH